MKGFMQLQTIIYVIFAVILLMVGLFSVESYLTNIKVDANYELDEIDLAIMGKRITNSCYSDVDFYEDFYTQSSGYKNPTDSFNKNCFEGFNPDDYNVSYFDMNKNLLYSEGNLDCENPDMNLILRSNTDILVEVCYDA